MSKCILMVAYTQYSSDARPRREAECLVSRGDSVDFISLAEQGRGRTERIEGVNVLRTRMPRYRGANSISYVLSYLRFFVIAFVNVSLMYFRRPYDVIYVHTMPDFMVFTALIPRFYGAKVILDIHDTMPELFATKFKVNDDHWLIRLLKFQEVMSARFAHRVVVTHDLHREIFVGHGIPDEKIFTSINFADSRLFYPREERSGNNQHILIYHGTIVERLGLDLALNAVAIVKQQIPSIRFHIIGDGEVLPKLIQLADTLQLNDNVYFSKKMIALDLIPDMIAEASIGIVPNRIDEATANMMPVKLLEYVAMEKPVVAARTRVIQHYFSNGMVKTFTAENVNEMADCILSLFNNPSECQQMVDKMKLFNKAHNWNVQRDRFFNLIDTIHSVE